MASRQDGWPKTPHFMARKDTMKRGDVKFIDYTDIVPGARCVPLNDDERKELKKAADKLKEFVKEYGVTFKITKGDES